jgi:uncharacterized membrane protein
MTAAVAALAAVGFTISTYFTAVAYRWMRPDAGWIPAFCRLGERTCASIVFTPRARVFGLPNSVLGQVFYAALLVGAALGLLDQPSLLGLYRAGSLVTVALAVYLSYSLLFVMRVPCPLCFASHGINTVIFVLLLL